MSPTTKKLFLRHNSLYYTPCEINVSFLIIHLVGLIVQPLDYVIKLYWTKHVSVYYMNVNTVVLIFYYNQLCSTLH